MEYKKLNLSFTKSQAGNISSRLILPISWIRELGKNEDRREVHVYKVNDLIVIAPNRQFSLPKELIESEIRKKMISFFEENKWISTNQIDNIFKNIFDQFKLDTDTDAEGKVFNYFFNLVKKFYPTSEIGIYYTLMYYLDTDKIMSTYTEEIPITEKDYYPVCYLETSTSNSRIEMETLFDSDKETREIIYIFKKELQEELKFTNLEEFKIAVGINKAPVMKVEVKDKQTKELLESFEELSIEQKEKMLATLKRMKKKEEKEKQKQEEQKKKEEEIEEERLFNTNLEETNS